MSYLKAVYVTIMTMGAFYVENFAVWVKTAVWDAPRRIYLDIELEKMKIDRECLSESTHTEKSE
ncbi:hypothetical protein [Dishui Lake phycodnavirus 3]|nr:hypothetical protein [Dishui Lake phycodnavirus 3]